MEDEAKRSKRWIRKIAIFLAILGIFGVLTKAQAQNGLLTPPTINVQLVDTNVEIGDTASFYMSAYCTGLGALIDSVTWLHNGKTVSATNITITTVGAGLISTVVSSTLTVKDASSADAGPYAVEVTDLLGILTGSSSSEATLTVTTPPAPIVVSAVSSGTGMASTGFRLEFSAPTGSNLVIEASSDLTGWSSLCTNVVVNGSVSWTDAVARAYPCRFYRARIE